MLPRPRGLQITYSHHVTLKDAMERAQSWQHVISLQRKVKVPCGGIVTMLGEGGTTIRHSKVGWRIERGMGMSSDWLAVDGSFLAGLAVEDPSRNTHDTQTGHLSDGDTR